MVKVVAFASPLAHSGKHRVAAVLGGDVVDKLLNDDSLAHARAAEKTNLASFENGADEVDNLDAGFQNFHLGGLFDVLRSLAVNRKTLSCGQSRTLAFAKVRLWQVRKGRSFVDGVTKDIEDAAQSAGSNRYRNRSSGVRDSHAAGKTVGGIHGNRAHHATAQMLFYLENEIFIASLHGKSVIDFRHVVLEFDIYDRPDYLLYCSCVLHIIFYL